MKNHYFHFKKAYSSLVVFTILITIYYLYKGIEIVPGIEVLETSLGGLLGSIIFSWRNYPEESNSVSGPEAIGNKIVDNFEVLNVHEQIILVQALLAIVHWDHPDNKQTFENTWTNRTERAKLALRTMYNEQAIQDPQRMMNAYSKVKLDPAESFSLPTALQTCFTRMSAVHPHIPKAELRCLVFERGLRYIYLTSQNTLYRDFMMNNDVDNELMQKLSKWIDEQDKTGRIILPK